MLLLALDTSAGTESAALLDDDRLLAARTWPGDRAHARLFFDSLRSMLAETKIDPARLDVYAVGLGPGSFTGLRMALSAALGMALPGRKTVYGLPSAEAAAAEAARETGCSRILVCGDGRRGRFWSGLFIARDGLFALEGDWRLEPLSDLPARLPPGGAVCTADWEILAGPLREAVRGGSFHLIERDVCPSAETVGRLALERVKRGLPSLPLSPIYLHPPVFIPPSFPVEEEEEINPVQESP